MRQKTDRAVVSFRTTHDAIAFETACEGAGAPGRLIPLPKEIDAGCGLAWSAPPDTEEALRAILLKEGIEPQAIQVICI